MAAPMRSSTATLDSSETLLRRLVDKLRYKQRLPTQVEISDAESLCQDIERQAQRESSSNCGRMTAFAAQARQVFDITTAYRRSDSDMPSGMSLIGHSEAEGKELVLRGEKRPDPASPASNPSKRRHRHSDQPAPVYSARVEETRDIQGDLGPNTYHNNDVTNSTNGGVDHIQSLQNPSTANHLTNSAPIYNQNINSGSGQQNIKILGNFELLPPPTAAAAPYEYDVPNEPEFHEQRGSGLQKFATSHDVKNKTAGDNRPGGHTQTLKGPRGRTQMRTAAPVYNQNVNSGSGQQNIDVQGNMGFQRQDRQESSRQGVAAGHCCHPPIRSQSVVSRPQRHDDQKLGGRDSGVAYPSGQCSPSRRRSRSPARVAPHSRSGSVISRPGSPRRYRYRRDDNGYGSDRADRRSRSPARTAQHSRSGSFESGRSSPPRYRTRRDDDYEDRYSRTRETSNRGSYDRDPHRRDLYDRESYRRDSYDHGSYDRDSYRRDSYGSDYGSNYSY